MIKKEQSIGWYVVAFLDILGQQDVLNHVRSLPNINDQEEMDVFMNKVHDFYRPLYSLRRFFDTSINAFLKIDDDGLTPSQIDLLKKSRSTPILYRYFSDSLIVCVPLRSDLGAFQCRAIYCVLAASAMTFLSCIAMGSVIRGGIEVGLAMDIEEGEIYGPALVNAHTLESKVAQYPRIVIGESMLGYLKAVIGNLSSSSSGEERANAELAQKSLDLLATDDDGHTFLDYLGTHFLEINKNERTKEVIKKAYNFIIDESNKHKKARNSKLGFRYTLLRNYFEARLPLWDIDFEN